MTYKINNYIKMLIAVFVLLFSFSLIILTTNLVTAAPVVPSDNSSVQGAPSEEDVRTYNCSGKTSDECLKTNPIVQWLNVLINVFAGIIGIGAVVMIIVAGIQYMSARDNPQAVQSAKEKITSVVIGLVAFGLLYAFVNWLIPGGVI